MTSLRRTLVLGSLAAIAGLGIARKADAVSILMTIEEPKQCPKALNIKAKAVNGGMIDFVVKLDAEGIADAGKLYQGRVGEAAYLEIATSDQKIGSVNVKGQKQKDGNTRYTFRLARTAAQASELHIALNLFEEDGTATIGGGVSMEIHLSGFLPEDAAPKK
jgi:hypothetical protein